MSSIQKSEGRSAFEEGRKRSGNPYDLGTHDWTDWKDGFDQAQADDEQSAFREHAARTLMQTG